MRKRFAIFGGLLGTLTLGLAISQVRLEKEPVYGGKPLSFWLEEFTGAPPAARVFNPSRRMEAEEAIRHIGTNGLPVFLRLLRASDQQWKMRLLKFASKKGFNVRYRDAYLLNRDGWIG